MTPAGLLQYQDLSDRDLLVLTAQRVDSLCDRLDAQVQTDRTIRDDCREERETTEADLGSRIDALKRRLELAALAAFGLICLLVGVGILRPEWLRVVGV